MSIFLRQPRSTHGLPFLLRVTYDVILKRFNGSIREWKTEASQDATCTPHHPFFWKMLSSSSRAISRARGASRKLSTVSRRCVPLSASTAVRNLILRQRFYTTERIVEFRSGKSKDELPKTLYDSNREKENCGVGLIASLKSVPSRDIVEKADEMLVRMAHRGGCGCDPASGDGSGTLRSSRSRTFLSTTILCC